MTLSCGSTLRLVPPRPRMRRQGSSSVLQGRRIRRHGRRSSLLAMAPLRWPAQKLRSLGIRLSTISRQRSVRSRPSRVRCTTPTRIRPSSYPRTGPSQPARVRAHTARTHACGRTCMPACTCTKTHAHAPWVRTRKQMHALTHASARMPCTCMYVCTAPNALRRLVSHPPVVLVRTEAIPPAVVYSAYGYAPVRIRQREQHALWHCGNGHST